MSKKKMPSIDDLLNPVVQEAPVAKSTAAKLREKTSKSVAQNASKPAKTQTRKPAKTQARKQGNITNVTLTGDRKTFSVYVDTGIQMQLDFLKMQLRMMGINARDASKSLMVEAGLLLLLRDFETHQEGSFLVKQAREQASKRASQ